MNTKQKLCFTCQYMQENGFFCKHQRMLLSSEAFSVKSARSENGPCGPTGRYWKQKDYKENKTIKEATTQNLIKACDKAVKMLEDDKVILATTEDAGFIIPPGQKRGQRTGYQVFVRVCRWDEALMKSRPNTGGLLEESK